MPKPRSEEDKKHGDTMESLIGRTGGPSPPEKRDDRADDEDPAQLQDGDDEDVLNDDGEDDPDIDERE